MQQKGKTLLPLNLNSEEVTEDLKQIVYYMSCSKTTSDCSPIAVRFSFLFYSEQSTFTLKSA